MKRAPNTTHLLALLAGICMAVAGFGLPAHAQTAPPAGPSLRPDRGRFFGEVTYVHPSLSGAGPDSFTVQLGVLTVDLHVDARTMFISGSAEAEVEGLLTDDYTVVWVRRVKRDWVARRVEFDVLPVRPLRLITGVITRVSPDGSRLVVRSDVGRLLIVRLAKQARYLVGSRPVDLPPTLTRGDTVQVLVLPRNGLVAFQLDLRPVTVAGLRL